MNTKQTEKAITTWPRIVDGSSFIESLNPVFPVDLRQSANPA